MKKVDKRIQELRWCRDRLATLKEKIRNGTLVTTISKTKKKREAKDREIRGTGMTAQEKILDVLAESPGISGKEIRAKVKRVFKVDLGKRVYVHLRILRLNGEIERTDSRQQGDRGKLVATYQLTARKKGNKKKETTMENKQQETGGAK